MGSEDLISYLRSQAITPGASALVPTGHLVKALEISRATLSRYVHQVEGQVITAGSTRRTAYALRRPLRGQLSPLPVYLIDEQGSPSQAGSLSLAHGHGCWLQGRLSDWPIDESTGHMRDGWYEGVPYQMLDMRPDGYLGRALARAHANLLQVSENPADWSDDDNFYALSMVGADTPGNLIVGQTAYQQWTQQRLRGVAGIVADDDRAQAWQQRADLAVQDGAAGSSAAGEFPKFTAAVRRPGGEIQHVLVKFSGRDDSPGSRRWADLLVCEHLALEALSELGVSAARSQIIQAGGRTFYEVDRFDRHGEHGRSPTCSWRAICDGLVGQGSTFSWEQVGRLLHGRKLFARDDANSLRSLGLLTYFGRFIQNTDMHQGNLSFVPSGGHFRVAPAYDMLPMHYAPVRGVELPPRAFEAAMPMPDSFDVALPAARAARGFWQLASEDARISDDFRAICAANALAIEPMIDLMSASVGAAGRTP